MNKLMFKFAVAAVVGLGVSALRAQEMGEEVEATAAESVEEAAEETRIPEIVPVPEDEGSRIAVDCQAKVQAVEPTTTGDAVDAASSAVREGLKKLGLKKVQGFIDERMSIIQIGTAMSPLAEDEMDVADISLLREMLIRQAELDARFQIASAVRQTALGSASTKIPGTKEFEKFNADHKDILAELARQKEEVRMAVKALDPATSNFLNGDLDDEGWLKQMEIVSRRLTKKFKPEEATSEIQAKLMKVEAAIQVVAKQIAEITELRDKEYPPKTNESKAASFAYIDLVGSLDLVQSESWDGKNYAVAVAVLWSPKLQERALATFWGKMPKGGKQDPENRSLDEWLEQKTQNGELAMMAGTRQFVDGEGCQYVIGISSVEIPESGTKRERKMIQAEQFAKQMVLFYLYSQGKGSAAAKGKLIAHDDRASDLSSEAERLISTEIKDITISGLSQVYTATCEHPISKRKIHVSVAAINPLLAAKSSEILKSWYASATVAQMGSQYAAQELQGMKDEHERIVQENEAGKAGYKAGQKAVSDSVNESAYSKALKKKPVKILTPPKKETKKPVKTTVVTEDITDDF